MSDTVNSMEHWKDRVALVTGASSGIGRAIARELAAGGLRIAVCARREERLRELQAELESRGAEVLAIPTDLRDETQIMDLFGAIREQWGGVDVLVNNAGTNRKSWLVDGDADDWRLMWEVNVLALSICTREAIHDMRRRGDDGHVIHIASMSGHRVPSGEGSGMYAATKFAVVALTEKLRRELRALESNIRVTAISPGFVETELAAKVHGEEAARELYSRYTVLQPADIASAVRYVLACPPHVQIHDILIRPTQQET